MIRLPFFTTASIVACIFAGAWAWKAEHPVLAAETWLQRDWTEEFVDSTGRRKVKGNMDIELPRWRALRHAP